MHWIYRLLTDREWMGRNAVPMNVNVDAVYLSRSSLDAAFDNDGKQILPLMARVTGKVAGLEKLLDRCGWKVESCMDEARLFQLMVSAACQV